MAFEGYLLKIGDDIFPLSYVFKDSYRIIPNRRQDLDPFRNANGELQRNVVDHTVTTITFQTKPMQNNKLAEMMKFIRDRYINEKEKKVSLTYYCPDLDNYNSGSFYLPDIEFPINYVDIENKRIDYDSFTLEFIEY